MLLNRERASKIMEREGVNGLIATTPQNVTYLTGHHGDFWHIRTIVAFGVLAKDEPLPVLISSIRTLTPPSPTNIKFSVYGEVSLTISENGKADEYDLELIERRKGLESSPNEMQALYKALRDLGLNKGRVAVDERNFARGQFAALEVEFPEAEFVDGYDMLAEIRAVKTEEEINRLRLSVQATEAGIKAAATLLAPGVTEKELEDAYNIGVAKRGAVPLFTIICSGNRSAHNNTIPGDRIIQTGDIVRMDLGSIYRYYKSDIARTFVAGTEPTKLQQLYYDAIVIAEEAAISALKPGVTAGEIFRIAVETARESGIPNFQRNHVGHGIGIETYDVPHLTANNKTIIEEGMVFCVETPYTEFGYSGIQIEDTMVVRKNGVELLSSYPKSLDPKVVS